MRPKLRKMVRELFALRMRQQLPQFRATKQEIVPQECELYVWTVAADLWFYICLQTHRRRDAFTIEIGWSKRRRWPECLPSLPSEPPQDGEMRFRLPELWRKDNIDVWWELDPSKSIEDVTSNEELLDRLRTMDPTSVAPLEESAKEAEKQVDAAFQKIIKYAVPYFEEVISSHGTTKVH